MKIINIDLVESLSFTMMGYIKSQFHRDENKNIIVIISINYNPQVATVYLDEKSKNNFKSLSGLISCACEIMPLYNGPITSVNIHIPAVNFKKHIIYNELAMEPAVKGQKYISYFNLVLKKL